MQRRVMYPHIANRSPLGVLVFMGFALIIQFFIRSLEGFLVLAHFVQLLMLLFGTQFEQTFLQLVSLFEIESLQIPNLQNGTILGTSFLVASSLVWLALSALLRDRLHISTTHMIIGSLLLYCCATLRVLFGSISPDGIIGFLVFEVLFFALSLGAFKVRFVLAQIANGVKRVITNSL